MQAGRSIDTIFEVEGGISNYSLSKDGKSMYVITGDGVRSLKILKIKIPNLCTMKTFLFDLILEA